MPRRTSSKRVRFSKRRASTKRQTNARYPRRYIKGSGAYTLENGPWAKRGASAGAFIGRHFAGPLGSAVGSYVGRRLAHYPARLFGSGDYTVNQPLVNSGSNNRISPPIPSFKMTKEGVRIQHTEYIGDMISSSVAGDLKIDTFAINPSDMKTFPWLSSIACQSFQQYKFHGLAFQFKSFSADALNSTNTALGAVFSAVNYDFTDQNFSTRAQIENSEWAQSCKPSDDVMIPVECKPTLTSLGGYLYVQNGAGLPADADPRLYNLGKLFLGSTGCQGTSVNLGSLYVTYDIGLYKPVQVQPNACSQYVNLIRQATGTSNPLGTSFNTTAYSADTIGCTFDTAGTTLTMLRDHLKAGTRLLCNFIWYGSSTAITHPSLVVSGAAFASAFNTWTDSIVYVPSNGATTTRSAILIEIECDGSNNPVVLTFGTAGTYPSSGWMQVLITQRNGIDSQYLGLYSGI